MVSKHAGPLKSRLSMRSRPIYPISAASLSRRVLRQRKAYTLEMLYVSHESLTLSKMTDAPPVLQSCSVHVVRCSLQPDCPKDEWPEVIEDAKGQRGPESRSRKIFLHSGYSDMLQFTFRRPLQEAIVRSTSSSSLILYKAPSLANRTENAILVYATSRLVPQKILQLHV